ncbi:MAG: thiamine phosphate synthase [Rhodomicrobium sp.]
MDTKPCGLICVVPPALQQEWADKLTELARLFQPAALIFKDPVPAALAQAIARAKPLELAVLVTGTAEEAAEARANGVYLSAATEDVAKARAALGSAGVIGAACGLSRHAAMESAEAGADFIAFDASDPAALEAAAELSLWWDGITGVPAALAFGCVQPPQSVLSKARPDFLLIEEAAQAGESLTFATEFGLQSQT